MERLRLAGYVRRPTTEEIRRLASMEYMNLTDEETRGLELLIDGYMNYFDRLDDLSMPQLEVKYKEREKGYRPTPEEDPYNVFIRKCLVQGASEGKLAGKSVGLKDNICVAGIPMTNGSRLIPNYIPDIDATVVERLLDAGATIVGKLNMDDFAFAGTSETSAYGCVRNPRNPQFSAGGSSGGSAAAVAAGVVDIALGVDEGGSARIPASWCGVTSIKPTHGLVPTFGISYMDHTVDFICPMAKTVEEVALALEVIAGDDPKDPQWVRGPIKSEEYTKALQKNISGMKVGLIKESMDLDELENDVKEAVLEVLRKVKSLGATWREVSIPMWNDAKAIWNGFAAHSISAMVESDLEGYWRGGFCNISWQEAFGKARRAGSDSFPPILKVLMVLGKYMRREYCSTYFSKAQNLRFAMRQQVDSLLNEVDVLVTPTTPMKAVRLLTVKESLGEMAARISEVSKTTHQASNTYPLNVTGHPALSMPCGLGENKLPIGLQLIGKSFGESLLFRVAYSLENS